MPRLLVLLLAMCATSAITGAAAAQSAQQRARQAYDRGAAAYDRGEYAAAAVDLALADALVPSAVALTTAIKATVQADDPVLGMTLVERASKREPSDALAAAAAEARMKFAARVGRLSVRCGRWRSCTASVDGLALSPGAGRWLPVGEHEVTLATRADKETRTVRVEPAGDLTLEPSPPPKKAPARKAPAPQDEGGGASPVWFWVTAAITEVLGAATIASAVDWQAKRDRFNAEPTEELAEKGRAAQTRVNVLLAVTAGGVVASAVLGIFVVRWSSAAPGAAWVAPGLLGARGGLAF